MGSIFHDDWFASGSNFGENLSRAILIPFDLVGTGASSMEEFIIDMSEGASLYDVWSGKSTLSKVDSIIDSGYLASGETLTYRTSKALYQELGVRGITDFEFSLDGSIVDTWGGVAAPELSFTPLDPTKVYGHLSRNTVTGNLNSDTYDFWDLRKGSWTLDQPYRAFNTQAPLFENMKVGVSNAKTFVRNQLNHIAVAQHGDGNPYKINFRYDQQPITNKGNK